ncbi:MAG TPA: hypothetical protein EYH35_01440 [Thiotrichaceae bacterium]|nr:hypothetical protein [Thiotrichaceae bacterium]
MGKIQNYLAIISLIFISSVEAGQYQLAQDMQISQVSTHHSRSAQASFHHSLPIGNNRLLLVAISSEGGSQHKVNINNKTIAIVKESYSSVKSEGNNCIAEFFYLLEKDLPKQDTLSINVKSDSHNFSIAAMSFYNVKQEIPQKISTHASTEQSIHNPLPLQIKDSLIIDNICSGQGLPRGKLEPAKNQHLIFHIGDNNESGMQMSGSFQRGTQQSNQQTQWRWHKKTQASNRLSQSIISIQPLKSRSALNAGEDQHINYWQGSAINLKAPSLLPHLSEQKNAYSTLTTRLTDEAMAGYNGNITTLQHMYSKDQAWNADQRYYKLKFGQIRASNSHQFITKISTDPTTKKHYTEMLWSTVDPDIIYGLHANTLNEYSLKTRKWRVLKQLPSPAKITTNFEGNLSVGDRYLVLNNGTDAFLYDIQQATVLAQMPVPKNLDWLSVSQSGKYIISNEGRLGVKLYDLAFNFIRQLSSQGEHADLGYDAQGNEVYVQTCPATMIRLKDGKKTDLLGLSYACGHVSTRNIKQPGWAYFSTRHDPKDNRYKTILGPELIAVKLDNSQTVRHLGRHYSTYHDYDREAKVVVSPDGKKIMFNSDWGQKEGKVFAYQLRLTDPNSLYSTVLKAKLPAEQQQASLQWLKVSGKGDVNFSNPTSAITQASFSKNGRYVLKLTATTPQEVISDELVVQIGRYQLPMQ